MRNHFLARHAYTRTQQPALRMPNPRQRQDLMPWGQFQHLFRVRLLSTFPALVLTVGLSGALIPHISMAQDASPQSSPIAAASDSEALKIFERFAEGLKSLEATFVQTLTDETGFEIARSEGRLGAAMPGRLDWEVIEPQPQRIVADGQELWNYEPSLNQVIVQRQGALAAGSPLQVLADPARVASSFRVTIAEPLSSETLQLIDDRRSNAEQSASISDPRTWTGLRLTPLDSPEGRDGEFSEVELWIDDQRNLGVIAFVDLFGQRTEMVMTSFIRNAELPASRFTFVLPDGVDVFRP
ncbi:MAG: LolA family protein [Thioalkalivibrionaceae bacterium]